MSEPGVPGPEPVEGYGGSTLGSLYRAQLERARAQTSRFFGEVKPDRKSFRADVVAGLPGAISSVPDGMASAVLAGVSPAHGLYASFAGPIAGGLTSSTRLMVVTTTSAAALAAGSALADVPAGERSDAMLWLTLIAGALMVLVAVVRLSRYIRFVSYSVMLGFLTGVAVNMVLGQIPDLLGVTTTGETSLGKAIDALGQLGSLDPASAVAGITALVLLVLLARTRWAVLGSLTALAIPTVAVAIGSARSADWAGKVTLVEDSGELPHGIPMPGMPELDALSAPVLWGALSVAVIVLVQGAGVAEAVPNREGPASSTRRDCVAQGLGNVASGLFGGQPVGGSVGQTALNVTAGARSRWASVWSGIWMALILVALSGIVGQVAMPTLAAVLVYAGVGTVRPREILTVTRTSVISAVAFGATFVAVLLLPVATAVAVGVACSLLLQLNQEALDLRLARIRRRGDSVLVEEPAPTEVGPGDVVVLEIYGSLFYAGARTLQRRLPDPVGATPDGSAAVSHGQGPVVILRLRGRTTLGATFLRVVGAYAGALERQGGQLYLSGVDPGLLAGWTRDGTLIAGGARILPASPELGASTAAAVAEARSRGGGLSDVPQRVEPERSTPS